MNIENILGKVFQAISGNNFESDVSKKEYAVLRDEQSPVHMLILLKLVHTHKGVITLAQNPHANAEVLLEILDSTHGTCTDIQSKVIGHTNADDRVYTLVVEKIIAELGKTEKEFKDIIFEVSYDVDGDSEKIEELVVKTKKSFNNFVMDEQLVGMKRVEHCMNFLKTEMFQPFYDVVKNLIVKESVGVQLLKKIADSGYLSQELQDLIESRNPQKK